VVSLLGWGQASRERSRATVAADEAIAISGFLTEILSAPDPYYDGSDVRVVDVLDRAAARADEEFQDRPEVATRIHRVLGDTYNGLGIYEAAGHHRRQALAHAEQLANHEHDPVLVRPLIMLARHFIDVGDFDRADSLITLAGDAAVYLPADSPYRFRIEYDRAYVMELRGDITGAIDILEPTFALAQERIGPEHEATIDIELALGNLLWQVGELERARDMLERGSETMERKLGPDNPATYAVLNNLAVVYQRLDDLPRAYEIFERILRAKQRTLGPRHPLTATGHHNLGDLLRRMGDPESALAYHETALDIARNQDGVNESQIAMYRIGLGRSLALLGRIEDALAALESALTALESSLSPDHPVFEPLKAEIEELRGR